MHYFIISIIIVVIIGFQIYYFTNTLHKLKILKTIFPDESRDNKFEIRAMAFGVFGIYIFHANYVSDEMVKSINNYLAKNKGAASDFHLMKNIVDRHCDAQEDEINTQIPVPLYLGLMGTMAGIIVGLGFLVANGGINSISADPQNINPLLGGVALAMFTSIIGIILTTIGSLKFKESKSVAEKSKNSFLSWIQGELLPNLSTDISGALVKMSQNLASFNDSFVSNAKELQEAIRKINESYKLHTKLIDAINKLKIEEIATANIEVYDKLTGSIAEIKQLGIYLYGINEYLSNSLKYIKESDKEIEVRKLAFNELIKSFDGMFREMFSGMIEHTNEEIKKFIASARNQTAVLTHTVDEQVTAGKGAISKTVGILNDVIDVSVSQLAESAETQINEFSKTTVIHTDKLKDAFQEQQQILIGQLRETFDSFQKVTNEQTEMLKESIENQQKALNAKLQETSELVTELKNLTAVKTSMQNLEKATAEQNEKIDRLSQSIEKLAQAKTGGNIIIPKSVKIALFVSGGVLSVSFLAFVILFVVKHFI
jgi:hypothetical protein